MLQHLSKSLGSRVFSPVALSLFLLLSALPAASARVSQPPDLAALQFRNTVPGVAYVGSKVCASCHSQIYTSYARTDMGRSMSLPSERPELQSLAAPVIVKHPKANRYFEVYRRGPDFYEGEYELDAAGKQVFRDEQKLAYIMGSGANGFTGVVRRGDFLFEEPLSYYTKARTWGLSPGYDQHDYGFSRPIQADCVSCHSGRPQPAEGAEGRFQDPPFLELSIGCESCHGPGALHVKERRSGQALRSAHDTSIVNPVKLPGILSDNICMYCHQGLDATALMPAKRYADFRPGTPLADTLAIFAVPLRRDSAPADLVLQHYALMTLSRCYLASSGRLHCTTCHDPHQEPKSAAAVSFYRSRCLTCHTEASCKLTLAARRAKADDCAGCHMPKQQLQQISHSSLTNHRILARPGEPLPDVAFRPAAGPAPGLLYLDAVPGAPPHSLPPLVLFRAYGELLASHPEYQGDFDGALDSLARLGSDDPAVLAALAMRKLNGAPSEAASLLTQAIRAGSANAQTFELLATLQARSGRTQDAVAVLKNGLEADPYSPGLYRLLAQLYVAGEDRAAALDVINAELRLFPEDSFMRSLRLKVAGMTGR